VKEWVMSNSGRCCESYFVSVDAPVGT
jgi:hypothetical protein